MSESLLSEQSAKEASGAVLTTTLNSVGGDEALFGATSLPDLHYPSQAISLDQGGLLSTSVSDDDDDTASLSLLDCDSPEEAGSPGDGKRRMSMTLPLPPGALPPRKRAKTKDEKEQRRIERIMRNRQAAHASREKKRRHVEELEAKCVELAGSQKELQIQLDKARHAQFHAEEERRVLQARLDRLEAAVRVARSSRDLSVVDNALLTPLEQGVPKVDSCPGAALTVAPGNSLEVFVDPLEDLDEIPLLTHSALDSPQSVDEFDADNLDLSVYTFSKNMSYPESSSKTHHPAVMV